MKIPQTHSMHEGSLNWNGPFQQVRLPPVPTLPSLSFYQRYVALGAPPIISIGGFSFAHTPKNCTCPTCLTSNRLVKIAKSGVTLLCTIHLFRNLFSRNDYLLEPNLPGIKSCSKLYTSALVSSCVYPSAGLPEFAQSVSWLQRISESCI